MKFISVEEIAGMSDDELRCRIEREDRIGNYAGANRYMIALIIRRFKELEGSIDKLSSRLDASE